MSEVSSKEIRQITENFENVIGALQLAQISDFNEAEKLEVFITSSRVLARVGLWCTTLNHNCLNQFLSNCSYGYHFNVDDGITWLLKYAKAFLSEAEFTAEKVLGTPQHAVEIDDEDDISMEIEKPTYVEEDID
jgi:hypothetical protein